MVRKIFVVLVAAVMIGDVAAEQGEAVDTYTYKQGGKSIKCKRVSYKPAYRANYHGGAFVLKCENEGFPVKNQLPGVDPGSVVSTMKGEPFPVDADSVEINWASWVNLKKRVKDLEK